MTTVAILAYRDIQALDLAVPLGIFGAANARRKEIPPYHLAIIGLDRSVVRAVKGLAIIPVCTIGDAPPLGPLIIPGGAGSKCVNSD